MFTQKQFAAVVATAIVTAFVVGAYCAGQSLTVPWHAAILAVLLTAWGLIVRILTMTSKGKRARA